MFCVLKIVVFNLVGNVKRDKKKGYRYIDNPW